MSIRPLASKLKHSALDIIHRITGVKCPICSSHYSKFEPFGLNPRENALCLYCGSLERHRLLWLFFESIDLFKGEELKVLHFAPEKVFYDLLSNKSNIKYYPVDLCPDLYNYNGPVPIGTADITSIPFDNDQFDAIICNHVLEHIPDDALAISELFRVLRKNGTGIFQVPMNDEFESTYEDPSITEPEERLKAFGQSDHVRWYGKDYKDRLAAAGFNVIEDDFVNGFTEKQIFKNGLPKGEVIYKCLKQS